MTTKNAITQKAAIAIVRNYVEAYSDEFVEAVRAENPDATVEDLLDVLGNMYQKLNRTRTTGDSKKRKENEKLVELILPALVEPKTAGEIKELFEEISSAPKATAVLKLGVELGLIQRLEKEKKSDPFRYQAV